MKFSTIKKLGAWHYVATAHWTDWFWPGFYREIFIRTTLSLRYPRLNFEPEYEVSFSWNFITMVPTQSDWGGILDPIPCSNPLSSLEESWKWEPSYLFWRFGLMVACLDLLLTGRSGHVWQYWLDGAARHFGDKVTHGERRKLNLCKVDMFPSQPGVPWRRFYSRDNAELHRYYWVESGHVSDTHYEISGVDIPREAAMQKELEDLAERLDQKYLDFVRPRSQDHPPMVPGFESLG